MILIPISSIRGKGFATETEAMPQVSHGDFVWFIHSTLAENRTLIIILRLAIRMMPYDVISIILQLPNISTMLCI